MGVYVDFGFDGPGRPRKSAEDGQLRKLARQVGQVLANLKRKRDWPPIKSSEPGNIDRYRDWL